MSVSTRPSTRPRTGLRPEQKPRRSWVPIVIVTSSLLLLALLAWGGYALWFSLTHVRASYARVTGLVVTVSAKSDARVTRVLVSTGDEVSKGQIVANLDKEDLRAEVDGASATLAARQSDLARAERELDLTTREAAAGVDQANAQVSAAAARLRQAQAEATMQARQQPDQVRRAEADLAAAKSRLTDARSRLQRMEKLRADGAVSDQDLDAARTEQQTAQAAVESAQAALAVAQAENYQGQIRQQTVATRQAEQQQAQAGLRSALTQAQRISVAEQQVEAQKAAVAEATAALEAARVRLSDAVLRSTINGVVVRGPGRTVKDGEVVETGTPIVTILATDVPYWISASISELYSGRVREGQPVLIRIDSLARGLITRKRWLRGRVEKVGAATEIQTTETSSPWMVQQVPLKVAFDPEGEPIKAGATCRVWIDIRR